VAALSVAALLALSYLSNALEEETITPQVKTPSLQEEVAKVYKIEKIEIKGLKFFNEEIIKPLIPFGKVL